MFDHFCGGAEYDTGGIRAAETQEELAKPLYPRDVFEKMADESFLFTKQMAALYKPDGAERVLEIHYTDIGKTYQILLTRQGSEVVADGSTPYTTRIETPYSVWRSISRGEISGQDALFQRRYRVLGDFSLMLKWDELFGAASPSKRSEAAPSRKTNMLIFLAPWIVIWTVLAMDSTVGGAIGVAAAACVPLLWMKFRPVVYEQISVPIVAGLSLAALLCVDMRLVLSGSYLAFGLIWTIGALPKIPLTARYSAVKYGGGKAFGNPLFISTNRILTAAWGAVYLLTPIWTYILMGIGFSHYIGLINSILPALMGVFTAWF
ncbi:MAG TPA: SCP2 sterol-binding domain-containing protein, partial [Bacillota bacterium]|nr:SCP2 sterol-binding domain-containing protein [Bacillota bacterium]